MRAANDLYCDGEHDWFPRGEFDARGVHTSADPPHYRIGGALADPDPVLAPAEIRVLVDDDLPLP